MTPSQWSIIDNSIKYYKSLESNEYLQPIHNHIYMNHHNWTIHYTNNFVENNSFYLKPSQHNELYIYAIRGLLKAIENYDGHGNFYNYGKIYMNGELYKGITDVGPMRLLPHSYRVNRKWRMKNKEKYDKYNTQIKSDINWESSYVRPNDMNTKTNILSTLTELTNEERMLFFMRYDHKMNKKYTLKTIGDFYGYSEETARKKIKKLHEKLRDLTYGLF
tara:strand:- start:1021 stop:1677 length:657 start_codon:yes stop_codon:yes gene_type:complete